MTEEVIKTNKRLIAARWFGLLGVVAAAAALVLVPVSLDTDAVLSNPNVAYYTAELRTLLMVSAVLLVAVTGMLVFDRRPLRFPVLIPVLTLLGVSALSTLFSDRPFHSLYGDRGEGLLSVAAGVLLFYALANGLTSRTRLRLFLAAATTAAALISVYGIAENYGFEFISGWGNPPFTDLGRSSATVGNPLTLAGYLTLMMGAATALWLGAGTWVRRLVWLFALALIGACWIYTEARGALLGTGIALPLVLLMERRKWGRHGPWWCPFAVLVASMAVAVAVSGQLGFSILSVRVSAVLLAYLALVGAFAWLLERGRIRLALLFPLAVLAAGGVIMFSVIYSGNITFADLGLSRIDARVPEKGDVSLQTRLHIWRDTIPMILDRPLLGYGPDNFAKAFKPYIREELKVLITNGQGQVSIVDRAHNYLLHITATTGGLGLAAYLWVLVSFFYNAYRRGEWSLTALSGVVLAYVLQLLTSFPSVATDVAFWGVLGAAVAVMRMHDKESGGPTGEADVPPPSRSAEREGRAELLVGAVVVGLLVAIAVPTFLQQQEKIAKLEQAELNIELRLAVQRYERFLEVNGTRPEAGVYTAVRPLRRPNGRPLVKPSSSVTITVAARPEGEFKMEGKKTSLAGTFEYSYDSATGSYTALS